MPGTQIHPKVTAAGVAGLVYTIVVAVANYYGVSADPGLTAAIGAVVSAGAGYVKAAPPKAA